MKKEDTIQQTQILNCYMLHNLTYLIIIISSGQISKG